jgi:hypothetical protein
MEPEKIDYAAWIGLDWGSDKYAICLQPAQGSAALEHCSLEQTPEALLGWFMNLLARFNGRKVVIAIEHAVLLHQVFRRGHSGVRINLAGILLRHYR